MPDQDMFNDKTTTPEPTTEVTPQEVQSDPFADKLKEIKNEQGQQKYADLPTALDALKASQEYIETLKRENREAKELAEAAKAEAERLGNIEDFVKKLKPDTTAVETKETPKVNTGLSEERVQQLLQEQLMQRETQSQQQQNLVKVTEKLAEMYGDKSALHLEQRAKELGTTKAELKELSMKNPNMALALLANGQAQSSSPSQPSIQTPTRPNATPNEAPKFEKGAARGGFTDKQLGEMFRKSKEYTNKRLGVEIN